VDADGRPKGDNALQCVLITVGEVDKLLMLRKNGAAGVNNLSPNSVRTSSLAVRRKIARPTFRSTLVTSVRR
jgi:hypothetical protein